MSENMSELLLRASMLRAEVTIAAYQAANMIALTKGEAPPHGEADFLQIIETEGLGYNSVIMQLQGR